jgi:ParB-like chromosome segregation protein Spo0J
MTSDRPFHPIANKYPLLSDAELQEMADDIKDRGLLHPIIMLRGKVLDGRNRWIACDLAGVERRVEQYDGDTSDEALEAFVHSCNDQRRHEREETIRLRKAERVERVADRRRAGESLRTIAEEEGISKAQVERDLEKAGQLSPQGIVEPDNEKVHGRDGRTRTAKPDKPPKGKELWCDRCIRFGEQTRDCKACKTVREEAEAKAKKKKAKAKKKPPAREELKDKTGRVLPDNLRDAFADQSLPKLIEELHHVEAMFRADSWATRAGKLCDHYGFILIEKFREHTLQAVESLQLAIEALKAGEPFAVCPVCGAVDSRNNGKTCKGCRGYGHVPETRYTELSK